MYGERIGACGDLLGKPDGKDGKRSLGRFERKWKDIKMDLQEVEWGGINWNYLAQDMDR
jgi:hypothetical protein